ncbi:MAG: DEAD/DEAH box helicase [Nitrospiria bacterium]
MKIDQHPIIRILKETPLNSVYTLATKETILRGFEYVRHQRVESYEWSGDFTTLTAFVRGTRGYTVDLIVCEEKVEGFCSCPAWDPDSDCKHVIAVLLTTKSLVSPESRSVPMAQNYREILFKSLFLKEEPDGLNDPAVRAQEGFGDLGKNLSGQKVFMEKPEKEEKYEARIEVRYGQPLLGFWLNGFRVNHSYQLPEEIISYFKDLRYDAVLTGINISNYLNRFDKMFPLSLVTGRGRTSIQWDPQLEVQCRTEFDADGKSVTLKALCLMTDKPCGRFFRFPGFAVDLESGRMGMVSREEEKGWYLFNRLYDFYYGLLDDPWRLEMLEEKEQINAFQIPEEQFKQAEMSFANQVEKDFLSRLILKTNKEKCDPLKGTQAHSLTAFFAKGGKAHVHLITECRVQESKGAPTSSFFNLFPFLETGQGVSPLLKAQKRKKIIYDTFFKLFSVKSKIKGDQIIREGLRDESFSRPSARREAKALIQRHYDFQRGEDKRLWLDRGRWLIAPNDPLKEALLYQIPSELFGIKIFEGMAHYDEMTVPSELFQEKLPVLYSRLKEKGFSLFYKGKRVVGSTWDFSFEVVRPPGIDWFEIKPEIRCDGKPVTQKGWHDLLSRHGAIEQEETIQVVDANAQKIFTAISEIFQSAGNGEKGKKEIVQVPRLQMLDWIDLRKEGVRIKLPPEDEALMERLTRFEKIEPSPLPVRLKAELRPYQKDGYNWLAFLYQHRLGGCLADDMGLGKTLQAISLLAGIREGCIKPVHPVLVPHLVIVPTSLVFNWENEIARFYPDLKVCVYAGQERNTDFKEADVVITTYGLLRRDIETLTKVSFHVILFDEAQSVKNIYADTTGAARKLKGYFKLVMTGTPLENHLGEYYSMIDLSLPGLLGEYDDFKPLITKESSHSLERILRRTKPFVLRRTKSKILKDLPPKTETDIYLELTRKQKELYQATVARTRTIIDEAYRSKTGPQAQIIALTALLRLRQLCVSPRLIDPEIGESSPKIEFLTEKLTQVLEEGNSALVFSQFTSFIDILEEELGKEKIEFLRLDGSTVAGKRKNLVQGFQEGEKPSVFLLSLKAGGQGLNLTRASYVFHLDPWWNPAVENQASDRAHRIGQVNKVTIMRILMRHTIEEKMMELKKRKLALYETVLGDSLRGGKGFKISRADFEFLLGN